MNIKIGEKIKQLRQRDGRKQEDLADALGISPQAVSRWEANGGYPDMELIPSIANFFHTSIDELFGYHDDREEKINAILDSVDEILSKQGFTLYQGSLSDDVEKCVNMLYEASEEFPNEPRILLKLAKTLQMWGWSKYGAKCRISDCFGVIEDDTEYNSKNTYWAEAMRVYEKLLKLNLTPKECETVICQLTSLYGRVGEYEKAKALACDQNSLIVSRELLLPAASTGEERLRYQSERIMALLSNMRFAVSESVASRPAVLHSEYGKKMLMSVIDLYETLFADGRCGKYHIEIGQFYLTMAQYEMDSEGSIRNIIAYFDKGFEHITEYARICDESEEYVYSAPLVSGLQSIAKGDLVPLEDDFWKKTLSDYRQNVLDEIKKIDKYKVCFR